MRSFFALALFALTSGLAAQQQPTIVHARVTTQTATDGLSAELQRLEKTASPQWVGYSVPAASQFTGGWNGSEVTYLEREGYHGGGTYEKPHPQDHAVILMRLAGGRIDKLRVESPERTLDAGDLPFVWLPGITPEDSVATLKAISLATDPKSQRDTSIFLISLHASSAAMPALVSLAGPENGLGVREKAAFWLANQRGHEGLLALQRFAREDKDAAFREKLTFDLTLSHEAAATDELIRMAHEDPAPRVRTQAQFWMAQLVAKQERQAQGPAIVASLRRSAESDPDVQARRQAVFAISRLPGEQATTQLKELATTSSHPEVRAQAVFWLGQSKDPRALAYLTNLLTSEPAK